MNKVFSVFILSFILAGCGSTVPLSNVPVSDAGVKTIANTGGQGSMSGNTSGAPGNLKQSVSSMNAAAKRVVYFDFDSSVVKPEYQSLISEHARLLKAQAGLKLVIEGHTDERGGREYNLALGQKRAEAVVGALIVLGVPSNQMEAISFGKEKPASPGTDESAFAKNRRAEIRYP